MQNFRRFKGKLAVLLTYSFFLLVSYSVSDLASFPKSVGNRGISGYTLMLYLLVTGMTLWAHFKCVVTDPGSVPLLNEFMIPMADQEMSIYAICAVCRTVKPPQTHHCSTCNRCIYRMDHHCPWVNNCIGFYTQKHFLLFLLYGDLHLFLSLLYLSPAAFNQEDEGSSNPYWLFCFLLSILGLGFMSVVLWQQGSCIYYNTSGIDQLQCQFIRRVMKM